jgi:hypothetical protein
VLTHARYGLADHWALGDTSPPRVVTVSLEAVTYTGPHESATPESVTAQAKSMAGRAHRSHGARATSNNPKPWTNPGRTHKAPSPARPHNSTHIPWAAITVKRERGKKRSCRTVIWASGPRVRCGLGRWPSHVRGGAVRERAGKNRTVRRPELLAGDSTAAWDRTSQRPGLLLSNTR